MELLIGHVKSKTFLGLLLLLVTMFPLSAQADIYKCSKGGEVAYQETPCEGANVKTTHIEDRGSGYFVGCFATTGYQPVQTIEVRANGAGAYQLVDEQNPLGSGTVLKEATREELATVSDGLHIKITDGLNRHMYQSISTTVYTTRYGNRFIQRSTPVAQPITSASLHGVYRGMNSAGSPITLLYRSGGTPQIIEKAACPTL